MSSLVVTVLLVPTGASLTESTTNVNVVAVLLPPSVTVRVTVAVPLAFANGVSVMDRLPPEPPSAMLRSGNKAWLLEVAVTTSAAAGESASATVKARGPSTRSSDVDWLATALMVGAAPNELYS